MVNQLKSRSCWAAAAAIVVGWRDRIRIDPDASDCMEAANSCSECTLAVYSLSYRRASVLSLNYCSSSRLTSHVLPVTLPRKAVVLAGFYVDNSLARTPIFDLGSLIIKNGTCLGRT